MLVQNLPNGFYEKEMKKYFKQYGRVTRLRLARSEKTGGSKGYAYIEFKYPEVAQVAAESMNNYLMFHQRLKTVYIPPAKQDHDYFKQPVKFVKTKAGKTKLITPKTVRVAQTVKRYNKRVSAEQQAERVERSKYKWVVAILMSSFVMRLVGFFFLDHNKLDGIFFFMISG